MSYVGIAMTKKYILSCVLVCTIHNSFEENLTLLSRVDTKPLVRFKEYRNVEVIHFQIPKDTIFAALKLFAWEVKLNVWRCKSRFVDLYMKLGALPVVNPDGVPLPILFRNISRSELYHLKIKSNKKEHYMNITSPDPGSYYMIVFLEYIDPKKEALAQSGLRPNCRAFLQVSIFIEVIEKPVSIVADQFFDSVSHSNESRYFKFSVVGVKSDQAVLHFKDIIFPDKADNLIIRLARNKPPTAETNYKEEFIYSNMTFYTVTFSTDPQAKYYLEIRFTGKVNSTISGSLKCQMKFISNQLVKDSDYYRYFHDKHSFNNYYESKILHNNYRITDLVPYKQYNLKRKGKTSTHYFSLSLEQELDNATTSPIHLTNSYMILFTFTVRDLEDVGATLHYILQFKSRKNEVIVACIRQGAIEVPTWPNKCVYNGVETPSPIVLNKTNITSTLLLPYPEDGVWYATFKLFCGPCKPCLCPNSCQNDYKQCVVLCELNCGVSSECQLCTSNCRNTILKSKDCKDCDCDGPCLNDKSATCKSSVTYYIGAYPCIFGSCNGWTQGACKVVTSGGVSFSTCQCRNKYRGWDCSDDSRLTTYCRLLEEVLLLVFSNVMFIPPLIVAVRRGYYVEAIAYSNICFFSTFYHACDAGENRINYCIMRWSNLQYADFFAAVLAFWVTLIAVANIPPYWANVTQIIGVIFIAIYADYHKQSIWLFGIPVMAGGLLVIVSWTIKYKKFGKKFVNSRYIYIHWPIGFGSITIGAICFCFLQTQGNYKYVHSFWHVVSGVSLLAILPGRNTFPSEAIL